MRQRRRGFDPWSSKWQPAPAVLPGKSHGKRSLTGYRLWGLKRVEYDSATTRELKVCLAATSTHLRGVVKNLKWGQHTCARLPIRPCCLGTGAKKVALKDGGFWQVWWRGQDTRVRMFPIVWCKCHHLCFIRKEARIWTESWTMINGRIKGLEV